MNDSIFTKTAAVVLTAAGVLGVAYGIAKYVTDFEAAKSEIQNLRGQIAQLHEVLSKAQFGGDAARIERLEKQVAEFIKTQGTAAPAAATAVATGASVDIAERLKTGGFDGAASDGKDTWPFRMTEVTLTGEGEFEARLNWTTMDSEHKVRGRYSATSLFFKEIDFLKKGRNNVLGCEYTLGQVRDGGLSGAYGKCNGSSTGGTIDVRWW